MYTCTCRCTFDVPLFKITATFSTLAIVFPALFSKDIYWVVRSHLIFLISLYFTTLLLYCMPWCAIISWASYAHFSLSLTLLDLGCRHTFKKKRFNFKSQVQVPISNPFSIQKPKMFCLEAAAVLPLYLLLKLIGMVFLFSHTTTTLFENTLLKIEIINVSK